MKIKKPYKKIALALSLCFIILWSVMGTGTSLAWFSDTSNEVNNIFHGADFNMDVFYFDGNDYQPLTSETKLFDDNALYEPGYTQIVYLRVENNGTIPFYFNTAINVREYKVVTNVWGKELNLKNHLRFAITSADSHDELVAALDTREEIRALKTEGLTSYATDKVELAVDGKAYVALVLRMPEAVGNEANYDTTSPWVKLGVTVEATQNLNQ